MLTVGSELPSAIVGGVLTVGSALAATMVGCVLIVGSLVDGATVSPCEVVGILDTMGALEGAAVAAVATVGTTLGNPEAFSLAVGDPVRTAVGTLDGMTLGAPVGILVGSPVGIVVSPRGTGAAVTGARVGILVGTRVGERVGALVGTEVGLFVESGCSAGVGPSVTDEILGGPVGELVAMPMSEQGKVPSVGIVPVLEPSTSWCGEAVGLLPPGTLGAGKRGQICRGKPLAGCGLGGGWAGSCRYLQRRYLTSYFFLEDIIVTRRPRTVFFSSRSTGPSSVCLVVNRATGNVSSCCVWSEDRPVGSLLFSNLLENKSPEGFAPVVVVDDEDTVALLMLAVVVLCCALHTLSLVGSIVTSPTIIKLFSSRGNNHDE